MNALSVIDQPNISGPSTTIINAAYRQLRYVVISDSAANALLPMYADIYTDIGYYKTITSYSIQGTSGVLSGLGIYEFDIQDAMQEYLDTYLPTISVFTIQQTDIGPTQQDSYVTVYFRGSSIISGLLVPAGPVPVQATATTPAVPGGGLPSNTSIVYLASLLPGFQDILGNDLEAALFDRTLMLGITIPSGTRIYPLSNLPKQNFNGIVPDPILSLPVYAIDCGGFPVTVLEFGTPGSYIGPPLSSVTRGVRVGMLYSVLNGAPAGSMGLNGTFFLTTALSLTAPHAFLLPSGMKEITAAVGSSVANQLMDPSNNYYIQIYIWDLSAGCYQFFTPWYKPQTSVIEWNRLCFQNTYGHFEWISFGRSEEKFITKSNEQLTPYYDSLNNTDPLTLGHKRNNIRANDEITITGVFNEQLIPWLKELLMAPLAFMQAYQDAQGWILPGATTGLPVLVPIKVLDGTFQTRKSVGQGRINYVVSFKVQPSWDYITLRN